ncbi:PAS domain S-box protein [Chryseolinea lacunae]|uniref:PAS domain S-box protein n=1 Tax=Chryseolinea lacunae TaxID=2801331 RepID=A0ABS1L1K6_9BACT|nr:PAS domain S-box protein [Chryseolinea lacunae]MBL0744411.1 PAS domain S-box protein [Chryseolinea lacunae]
MMKTFGIVAISLGLVLLQIALYIHTQTPWLPVAAELLILTGIGIWVVVFMRTQTSVQQTHKRVGEQVSRFLFNSGDTNKANLMVLETELKNATEFIKYIGEGKFDVPYPGMTPALHALNQNNLSGELLNMKDKMRAVAEEERQRMWTASGLTRFSELARQQHQNTAELLNQFIGELVRYIGANQGGIFVVGEDDHANPVLELKGCYAYGRRKFVERIIAPGEGLVGQAFLEGDVTLLTNIPRDYVNITSGLGEATPRCVVLVPLKNYDTVEGVLEVASFTVWKKYEADFLERVGEILGAALSDIRMTEATQKLLAESQQQATQLKTKEEELRQNLEEIHATQEALERKSTESLLQNTKLNAILDSAADTIFTADRTGKIESMNRAGLELLGYAESEIIGKSAHLIFPEADMEILFNEKATSIKHNTNTRTVLEAFQKRGEKVPVEFTVKMTTVAGKEIFTCILHDITERVKSEHDQQQYIEELRAQEEELSQNMRETRRVNQELDARVAALNTSTIMSESNLYGDILYVNEKFCQVSQYSREELVGAPHKKVRHPDMPGEVFKAMWTTIKAGNVFRGIVKNRKKDGSHYWVDAVISPVLDERGKPIKYIGVRYVIEDDEVGSRLFEKQLLAMGIRKEVEHKVIA